MKESTLGSRMKNYETKYEGCIPYNEHMIVRIDGHHFSSFTKGFNKPFDNLLSECMEKTTKDLVERFNAVTGYTGSDEITLVIPMSYTEKQVNSLIDCDGFELYKPVVTNQQIFTGRTQKIASLISSYTTMMFTKHFNQSIVDFENMFIEDKYLDTEYCMNRLKFLRHKVNLAYFDARVFGIESDEEVFNNILWRIRDVEKNSKAGFAQAYCSHKSLLNKNSDEQIIFCKESTGRDWNSIDDKFKYGILVKREQYQKLVEESYSSQPGIGFIDESVYCTRTRIVSFSEKLTYNPENIAMVMGKYK